MMETNKYYKPSLEEFHVGFEFEEWENPAFTNEEWISKKIEYFTDLEYVCIPDVDKHLENYVLGTSLFRVKYLDSEDIKSLGFIYGYRKDPDILDTDNHSCNSYQCILRDVDFCNSSRSVDLKMTYLGTENNPCVYRLEMYERNYFEWFPIFEGNIKNKSELKRLLKMIGAIE